MGHNTTLMGRKEEGTAVFFGETGPHGTTAFKGGGAPLNFTSRAVNENRVMAVKGGAYKKTLPVHQGGRDKTS